jgi:hypothetical protein
MGGLERPRSIQSLLQSPPPALRVSSGSIPRVSIFCLLIALAVDTRVWPRDKHRSKHNEVICGPQGCLRCYRRIPEKSQKSTAVSVFARRTVVGFVGFLRIAVSKKWTGVAPLPPMRSKNAVGLAMEAVVHR